MAPIDLIDEIEALAEQKFEPQQRFSMKVLYNFIKHFPEPVDFGVCYIACLELLPDCAVSSTKMDKVIVGFFIKAGLMPDDVKNGLRAAVKNGWLEGGKLTKVGEELLQAHWKRYINSDAEIVEIKPVAVKKSFWSRIFK